MNGDAVMLAGMEAGIPPLSKKYEEYKGRERDTGVFFGKNLSRRAFLIPCRMRQECGSLARTLPGAFGLHFPSPATSPGIFEDEEDDEDERSRPLSGISF